MRIPIHLIASRVVRNLALCAVCLGALHLVASWLWLNADRIHVPGGPAFVGLFHMGRGANVPSLWAALLLGACALLSILIARASDPARRTRSCWWVCALVLAFLAIDESTAMRESLTEPLRRTFDPAGPGLSSWKVPGSILLGAFVLLQARFLIVVAPGTRSGMLLAGLLYVSGAVGMEMFGGPHAERNATPQSEYVFMVLVEKGLELAGAIVLFGTLLRHMADEGMWISVRLRAGAIEVDESDEFELTVDPDSIAPALPTFSPESVHKVHDRV